MQMVDAKPEESIPSSVQKPLSKSPPTVDGRTSPRPVRKRRPRVISFSDTASGATATASVEEKCGTIAPARSAQRTSTRGRSVPSTSESSTTIENGVVGVDPENKPPEVSRLRSRHVDSLPSRIHNAKQLQSPSLDTVETEQTDVIPVFFPESCRVISMEDKSWVTLAMAENEEEKPHVNAKRVEPAEVKEEKPIVIKRFGRPPKRSGRLLGRKEAGGGGINL